MKEFLYNNIKIIPLSRELAQQYSSEICQALDQIPLVDAHTEEQLLAEKKGKRILHRKWEHSLIAIDNGTFAGIILGYEREAENNEQYPKNSMYVSDFAVASKYQKKGLGKFLIQAWIQYNEEIGFIDLDGKLIFSVQTNSASWNTHVQNLYVALGFKQIATKKYDNRMDNVYFFEPKAR